MKAQDILKRAQDALARVKPRGDGTIPAGDWNTFVNVLLTHRPAKGGGKAKNTNNIPHAWQTRVEYDDASGAWVLSVTPGFVRSEFVEVRVPSTFATTATLARLGMRPGETPDAADAEKTKSALSQAALDPAKNLGGFERLSTKRPVPLVNARLTERPGIPVFADDMLPRSVRGGEFGVSKETDGVPELFYTVYNVMRPKQITIDPSLQGAFTVQPGAEEQDRGTARQLYSFEVMLLQPRPNIVLVQDGDPAYPGGVVNRLFVRWGDVHAKPPRLEVYAIDPREVMAEGQLTVSAVLESGAFPYDFLKVATVWLMSPAGDLFSDPDSTWEPLVQHHLWYNVDYSVNARVQDLEPTRIYNPAAGLTSGVAVQPIVDGINAMNAKAEEAYNNVTVEGIFWSV